MKCHNCKKPAIWLVGPEESRVGLCVDCYLKLMQAAAINSDMQERQINYLASMIDMSFGIRGLTPRFPERHVIQVGDVTLHNIKVEKSNVGVVNAGTIGKVDVALTTLKHSGSNKVADAIKQFTEAVIASQEASQDLKNEVVEILSIVVTEATAPEPQRRPRAVLRLLADVATLVSGVHALAQLWQQLGPVLVGFFT